jgi:AcrR family transcriptional regulator
MDPAARERLLEVVLARLGEEGRDAMGLAGVLARAGVAEAEFRAEYTDLDACLADAYEWLTIQLDGAVGIGCATGGGQLVDREAGWQARVRGGLGALLVELAADPGMARVLTATYPSLGPAERMHYEAFVASFAARLRLCREVAGEDRGLPAEVDMLAVGAAEAIVVEEIGTGRAAGLVAMGPEILFSVLVPLIGAGAAVEEMERARREV